MLKIKNKNLLKVKKAFDFFNLLLDGKKSKINM